MSTPGQIRIKQGETLKLGLSVQSDTDLPVDVSAGTWQAQVRDAVGTLVADLTVVPGAGVGLAAISADTSTWPAARLIADVRLTLDGVVQFSETFSVIVDRPVTAP